MAKALMFPHESLDDIDDLIGHEIDLTGHEIVQNAGRCRYREPWSVMRGNHGAQQNACRVRHGGIACVSLIGFRAFFRSPGQ